MLQSKNIFFCNLTIRPSPAPRAPWRCDPEPLTAIENPVALLMKTNTIVPINSATNSLVVWRDWMNICSAYYAYCVNCAYYALLMNDSKITWPPIAASFCSSSKATAVSRLLRDDFLIPRGLFPTLKIKKKIVKEQSCSTECPFRCKCLLIAFLAPPAHIHYHLLAYSIGESLK